MTRRSTAVAIACLLAAGVLPGCQSARSFVSPAFRDDNWTLYNTPHFVIHVRPGSAAETDVPAIGPYLESSLRTITDRLAVRYDSRIEYLLFSSLEDRKAHGVIGGEATTTGAVQPIQTIVAVYQSRDVTYGYGPHEITHIVTYWTIGVAVSSMLEEGTAVYMAGGFGGRPANAGAAQYLASHKIAPLATMFDNQAWDDVPDDLFYVQSGSFVQYLFERFGAGPFKAFYTRASNKEYVSAFQQIYGVSIDGVYADWLRALQAGT